MLQNTHLSYGAVARWLHWGIALAILTMFVIGFSMSSFHGATFKKLMFVHQSLGITILVCMVFRLLWRWSQPSPALPASMARHEKFLAHAMAWLLYVVTFTIIAAGILMTMYHGSMLNVWGVVTIHFNVASNRTLTGIFRDIHVGFVWVLITALVLHICAACYHHFIRKDGILNRMLK